MKRIYQKNGVLFYYGNAAGYVDGKKAVVDSLFEREEFITFLTEKEKLEVKIKEGVYDRLADGTFPLKETEAKWKSSIRIYQLKTDSNLLMRFISLEERKKRGFYLPHPLEYDLVYEGEVDTDNLERIWDKFQRKVPKGFEGHSLSISDVVEIFDQEESHFYYVDRITFVEIPFKAELGIQN